MEKNEEKNSADQEKINELNSSLLDDTISVDLKERIMNEINELENAIVEREQENERIEERMSLWDRIKIIFKKYGFTVTAIITSVSVIIGVIVSNLSPGLTKMAKGVGNGLKDIGKKLAQILPGMIGTIAGFIFKTAGEVVGFLAKNARLLIVGIFVYYVESLKKKNEIV